MVGGVQVSELEREIISRLHMQRDAAETRARRYERWAVLCAVLAIVCFLIATALQIFW
jgi:hypothetical protein